MIDRRRRAATGATYALWCGVTLLALLGIGAATGRSLRVSDFATRLGPFRAQLVQRLGLDDPLAGERPAEFDRFDRPFADHPAMALLHVVPGAVFLALAPLQFSSRFRGRYLRLHRWLGRLLISLAFVSTISGFYFGILMPFGGWSETFAITLFGALFLIALSKAFRAIRSRHVAQHREWMVRAFAIALGISTVRVVGAILDLALLPAAFGADQIFVMSIWIGWTTTAAAAEAWIRLTRRRRVRMLVGPVVAV